MADTRRINRGNGHSYILDGEPVPGVTSILNGGVPKPALIDWAARATAEYAINNWDQLAQEGLAQRLRKIEKGRWEAQKAATTRGTKVHEYAAALAVGQTVDVPDQYRDHVDQCLRFLEEWDIRHEIAEVTVINRQWRYMGACDLIATVGTEPGFWLFDWKTGGSGIWPETALQLAAYAHCETMLVEPRTHVMPDGEKVLLDPGEEAMPTIVRAAAVSLKADYYEVIPVDISDDTFRSFLYVQQVAQFCDRDRTELVFPTLPPPTGHQA